MVQPHGTDKLAPKRIRGLWGFVFCLTDSEFLSPLLVICLSLPNFTLPLPSYRIPDFIAKYFSAFHWHLCHISSKLISSYPKNSPVKRLWMPHSYFHAGWVIPNKIQTCWLPLRPPQACRGKRAQMIKQPKKRTRWVSLKDYTDTKVSWALNSG